MMVILIAIVLLGSNGQAALQTSDILDAAARQPLGQAVQQPDGSWRTPKYGDARLEAAAERLAQYPRPWTVQKTLVWYQQATQIEVRVDLLRVLAASRDPRAGLALGNALKDPTAQIRVEATEGLMDYFLGYGVLGGTENQMLEVERWSKENRDRLKQEADKASQEEK